MADLSIHDADTGKLEAFAQAFHDLYRDKGLDASLDEDQLKTVLALAVDALGQPARDFLALVDPLNPLRPADPDEVKITCQGCSSDEIKAAVALVSCYRHSDDIEHSPSP